MLTCVPDSIFSWNYQIDGATAGGASVSFSFWSEQGALSIGARQYEIIKQGPFSGRWTLERDGEVVSEAIKQSLARRFDLTTERGAFVVQAEAVIGRSFEILFNGHRIGSIRPDHAFTRRASIECSDEMSEVDQIFAFWLAALTWRRAQRNS